MSRNGKRRVTIYEDTVHYGTTSRTRIMNKKEDNNMKIEMNSDKIKIDGHVGTWYVIDHGFYMGEKVFLLEHETFGDMSPCLIVNADGKIVLDEVWNGLEELEEL